MHVHVDSTKSSRGTICPSHFHLKGADVGIAEIVEEWTDGHEHFYSVKDADENIYLLAHKAEAWDLLSFTSKRWAELFLSVAFAADAPPPHRRKGNGRLM
jgi:hypothetical protein